jgi:hypothetical protein
MKSKWVLLVLPVAVGLGILGSCASTKSCNNDACYERKLSSVNPYEEGEIAAWGSEKEAAELERHKRDRQLKEPRVRRLPD